MNSPAVDVLSDVLRAVRLTGAVYFDFELTSPWVAEAPPGKAIAATVMPGAQRVMEFHLLTRGKGWANAIGQKPIRLDAGDVLVFPQGDPHVLSSSPGMRAAPEMTMYQRRSTPLVYEFGGGGPEGAHIVCGFLGLDERPYNPLLDALPQVIHVPAGGTEASAGWLATLSHIAVAESGHPTAGSDNVLARLSELMFVEAVRRHLASLPASHGGWLAGLRDEVVGRALAALHGAPAEPWTLDRLSRNVGASRSVLAGRFVQLVGQPPMQYLALWRMQLAARLLGDGRTVGDTARAVGYESDAAFSRAFKKLVGVAPATWRRLGFTGALGEPVHP